MFFPTPLVIAFSAVTLLLAPGQASAANFGCFDLLTKSMQGVVAQGRFETFRGLRDYEILLGDSFSKQLDRLDRKSLWIDMGAGSARAQKEYVALPEKLWHQLTRGKAETLAVGYTRPKTNYKTLLVDKLVEGKSSHHELFGRFVEDIPDAELGRADLITDVFGPLAYTERLDEVVAKYLRLLNDDGAIFVHMADRHTQITARDGAILSLPQWLATIPGLEVQEDTMSFRVTKTRSFVAVPRLKLIGGMADVPPTRYFREL